MSVPVLVTGNQCTIDILCGYRGRTDLIDPCHRSMLSLMMNTLILLKFNQTERKKMWRGRLPDPALPGQEREAVVVLVLRELPFAVLPSRRDVNRRMWRRCR